MAGNHRAASVRPTRVRGGWLWLSCWGPWVRVETTASDAPEGATPPAAPLSARIELDTQTVTIGGTIEGRVVVANNTGENIDVIGCGSIFQVALANTDTSSRSVGTLRRADQHPNRRDELPNHGES